MVRDPSKLKVGSQRGSPGDRAVALAESRRHEAIAVELRSQGKPWADVAIACGFLAADGSPNTGSAYKAWKRGIERVPAQAIEDMRAQIWSEQQAMIATLLPRVINAGDTYAAREITLIHDRMAKLFGLDKVQDAAPLILGAKRVIIVEADAAPLPPALAGGRIVDAGE